MLGLQQNLMEKYREFLMSLASQKRNIPNQNVVFSPLKKDLFYMPSIFDVVT